MRNENEENESYLSLFVVIAVVVLLAIATYNEPEPRMVPKTDINKHQRISVPETQEESYGGSMNPIGDMLEYMGDE